MFHRGRLIRLGSRRLTRFGLTRKLLKPLRVLKISNQRVDVKEKVRPNGVRAAIADPRYLAVDDAETLRGQK